MWAYLIIALQRSDPLFRTCADPTNSSYIIEYAWGGKWWNISSILFLFIFINNQYNDQNLGLKVFYDGMVMFYVHLNLHYHTFILKNQTSVALLDYVMNTLTTGTRAHVTPLLLTPLTKRWCTGVRSFCTQHMYLSIRLVVFYLKSCHLLWSELP